jgi:PAS domain S-box-containing protein
MPHNAMTPVIATVLQVSRPAVKNITYFQLFIEISMSDVQKAIARDSQFRLLVEAITDYAIYSLDTDGVVITWNTGAERAKGYTAQDILGRHFSLFFTPEDRAAGKPAQALATARSSGRFDEEGWRVRKDGTQFWASVIIDPILDENGQLVGFAKITRDMTETRADQEAIRQSERHFRLLMDSVVDYAIYTLDPEGHVTSWNSGAERIKGYTKDEMLGQHFSRFFTFEDQVAGKPAQVLAAARANQRFDEEAWRIRKDGTRFWASVVIEPMWDNDGQLVGFAKVTRDITDRQVLEEAKERLYQAQKMEIIGQFSGGVAHDFNNLLAVVLGSVELIARTNDDDRVRRLTSTAHRAATRGAKLTDQLLAYSQQQVLQPEVLNINDLTQDFRILLAHTCGRSIDLHLNLGSDLWLSDVDQAQFESALVSLAVNAREAMPKGGTLTIETQNILVDSTSAVELTITHGPYVAITVRDTGTGMTPEVRARAVEPFFSTKDIGRGSGLGLSQVHGFARQSNGQMTISSEMGRGTSVSIYLPKSTMIKTEDIAEALHASEHGRKIVLVVEDDPDVLEMATEAVRNLGYEALPAGDAATALEILRRDQWIDFLFTDVVMPPGMNGVELALDACRLRPGLRVLLSSGYPREALRDNLREGMAFIAKPYTISALGASLAGLNHSVLHPCAVQAPISSPSTPEAAGHWRCPDRRPHHDQR